MKTKQLKPGQLCTIERHVYRCKKRTTDSCVDCEEANHSYCILTKIGAVACIEIFGNENYPVLVK